MDKYKLELYGHYEVPVEDVGIDYEQTCKQYDYYDVEFSNEELQKLIAFLEHVINTEDEDYFRTEVYEELFENNCIDWGNDSAYVELYPILTGYRVSKDGAVVSELITYNYSTREEYYDLALEGIFAPNITLPLTADKRKSIIDFMLDCLNGDILPYDEDTERYILEAKEYDDNNLVDYYLHFLSELEDRNDYNEWDIPQGWE